MSGTPPDIITLYEMDDKENQPTEITDNQLCQVLPPATTTPTKSKTNEIEFESPVVRGRRGRGSGSRGRGGSSLPEGCRQADGGAKICECGKSYANLNGLLKHRTSSCSVSSKDNTGKRPQSPSPTPRTPRSAGWKLGRYREPEEQDDEEPFVVYKEDPIKANLLQGNKCKQAEPS